MKAEKERGNQKREGNCNNCNKPGHWVQDCWEEGGGKEGQGPKRKGKAKEKDDERKGDGSKNKKEAAASVKAKAEDDAAWFAISTFLDFEDEHDLPVPIATPCPDLDDLLNVSTYAENSPKVQEQLEPDNPKDEPVKDMGGEARTTTFAAAALTEIAPQSSTVDIDLFDSGASRHMSGHRHRFTTFVKIEPKPITAADTCVFYVNGKEDLCIEVPNGDTTSKFFLKEVLYAPSMGVTLVSISKVTDARLSVLFHGEVCRIFYSSKVIRAEITKQDRLYRLFTVCTHTAGYAGKKGEVLSIDELHRRLGHVGHEAARQLIKKGLVKGIELDEESEPSFFPSCKWGKSHRKAIQKERKDNRAMAIGDEVHSDVWGPAPVETINHMKYVVTFTDGHARETKVAFMRNKAETFEKYQDFEAWLWTQHGVRIKMLHSDRGGEYLSEEFSKHLKMTGTIRRLTVHDTLEYNGIAERLNRTLMEKVRAMLHDSKLPKFLWGEALKYAVYVKNHTWTHALDNTTPFEVLTSSKPDISNLRAWGQKVWVHDQKGTKLDGRAKKGYWVGIDDESKAHRIYWPKKRSVTVERSIKFIPKEVGGEIMLFEGENDDFKEVEELEKDPEPDDDPDEESNRPVSPPPIEEQPINNETPASSDNEGPGKRIRKPSAYVQRIKEGEGSATGRESDNHMPRGLQPATEMANLVEVEEWAMATVMDSVEYLNPTYEEARKRSDWPKWAVLRPFVKSPKVALCT